MLRKLLLVIALTILAASIVVGCGDGSPCPSTLTILSITEGEVLVMKGGTDDWGPAEQGTELDIGDAVKTGGNSSAKITFFDGSTMELRADTEVEILSLDIACETGITTVGLLQTIGTTISRVTAILDPASSYEVETPSGVVGVRGSEAITEVIYDSLYYESVITLVTNVEGNVYAISEGVKLDVPEGERCIMIPNQEPNLMPVANDDTAVTDEHTPVTIPVLDNDYDLDEGDTLALESVTQGTHGDVAIIDDQHVQYSPDEGFNGIDEFTYTVSDGRGGTDTANVEVTVLETSARIDVTADPSALIFIWDDTLGEYAMDKDTKKRVDGTNHETGVDPITVAGGRDYYVWVDVPPYCVYYVDEETLPDGWFIEPALEGDDWAAYGYLAADALVSVSFAGECSY
ncbi:MAG: cadherin-like domain-containing protein [Chloroflexota bacterium]|nr:MAG: cadherin-like domain-containing protein [Chloroflexota bacterium]